MAENAENTHLAAVIGAGPAGLYAAQYLARKGVEVVLFNRDIKPGGLAEYGIFPDKTKMRDGLQAQFMRILEMPNVQYCGNVKVGQSGDLSLDQLRKAGFQAFMVTTGAQENYWLGLPGEDLRGVYQANDIVFKYNRLPEKADHAFDLGRDIAVIGVGNVMLDILHYLKKAGEARRVTAYARRGPTEVKFDRQTLAPVAECLNLAQIQTAVEEALTQVAKIGSEVAEFIKLVKEAREKGLGCEPLLDFHIKFLRSPRRLLGDDTGRVKGIVFEKNTLELEGDRVVPQGTGEIEEVKADTVIFSIGSRVDAGFGLPVAHGNFITAANPRYPVDGISYEAYNPELCVQCEDIFVSGWARMASEGVVGLARKDAERGAKAMLKYLGNLVTLESAFAEKSLARLQEIDKQGVTFEDIKQILRVEEEIAAEYGLESYKFDSQAAMLRVVGKG